MSVASRLPQILRRGLLVILGLVVVLVCGFFAIGGYQYVVLLRGPSLPELPRARGQAEARRNDAVLFKEAVLRNDRSFDESARSRFEGLADRLIAQADRLDEGHMAMEMARAMALADNAHSHLVDPRLRRLPFRLHWFVDGLYVVKAAPGLRPILGARVHRLGGVAVDELLRRLDPFLAGTSDWKRYRSEYFLTAPVALSALGASVTVNVVGIEFTGADGDRESRLVSGESEVRPSDASQEWQHLLPDVGALGTGGWLGLLGGHEDLPLFLKHPELVQFREYVPTLQAIYVRLYGSLGSDSTPVNVFLDQTLTEISERRPKHLILDLRFNWGGDYTRTRKFSAQVASALPSNGRVFLITGPNTFSAGLIMAARIRAIAGTKSLIVGSPVGDRLQFWAEGFLVDLPSSGIRLSLSTARHDFKNGCGWLDSSCFVLNKFLGVSVNSLEPDLPVAQTFADYAATRDPIFERIAHWIRGAG